MLGTRIVVFQIVFDTLDELRKIFNDLVGAVFSIIAKEVVTKDDSLSIKHLLLRHLELFFSLVEDELLQDFLVLVVNHTIGKDSHVLVEPKLQQADLSVDRLLVSSASTLEDFADITQVESVVRLVGRGLQLGLHAGIDILGRLDELVNRAFNFSFEAAEETVKDLDEDHGDRLRVQISVRQVVVMSLQTGSDRGTTTAWGAHGGDQDDVLNLHEVFLFGLAIVPALVVHELTDQLDGRLSEVHLSLGHVQIIDEDDELCTSRWPIDTLSTFLELLVKTILRLVGRGLSRECDGDHGEFFRHLLVEHVSKVDCLACSSGSWAQHVLAVRDQKLLHILHADGVEGGHDDLSILGPWVDVVGLDGLAPVDPLLAFLVVAVVVNGSFKRDSVLIVLAHK